MGDENMQLKIDNNRIKNRNKLIEFRFSSTKNVRLKIGTKLDLNLIFFYTEIDPYQN